MATPAKGHLAGLGRDTLVYGLAQVLSRGLPYLLLPLYARGLSAADFGIVDVVTSVGILVSFLLAAGLDDAEARYWYDTEDPSERRRTLTTSLAFRLVWGVLGALVLGFWGPAILAMALRSAPDSRLLWLLAAGCMFDPVVTLVGNQYRRERRPWPYLGFSVLLLALTLILTVVLVTVLGRGVRGYFEALVGAKAVMAAISLVMLPRWLSWSFSVSRLRQLLAYGLPLLPAGLATWVLTGLDRILLERVGGLEVVGAYGMALRVAGVMALGTSSFSMAWSPLALSIRGSPEAGNVFRRALALYSVAAFGTACLAGLLAPELLSLIGAREFAHAAPFVAPLVFARALSGLYPMAATGLTFAKKTPMIGWSIVGASILNAALLWIVVPRWGGLGAATAAAASQAVMVAGVFALSQAACPLPWRWRDPVLAVLAAGAAWAAARYLGGATPGFGLRAGVLAGYAVLMALVLGVRPRRAA